MRDLKSPALIKLKAVLFLLLGTSSAGLILARAPSVEILILLVITIWSFCRIYYFAFYVIETYLDATYKYSGLFSLLQYLFIRKRLKNRQSSPE